MTISWGTAQGAGNKFRVGIELSVPTPGRTDLTVAVVTKIWVWTKDAVTDTSTTLSFGGNIISGSQTATVSTPSNSDWSTKNQKLLKTTTTNVATSHNAQTLTLDVSLTGLNEAGAGATARHSRSATLPASPVDPPQAPTGCAVTYVNDTTATVTWTNTNPTLQTAPYVKLEVERWDNVRLSFVQVARLGVVSSFTDSTLIADRGYQYRVRAVNGDGASAYATSGFVETTPWPPFNILARRPTTNIEVSWTSGSTIARTFEVWHLTNGVLDAAPLASVSSNSYTHVAPSTADTHAYRIKTVAARTSGFSANSAAVPPLTPPLTPTSLTPSGVLDAADEVGLGWEYQPSDGTSQVAFRVKWREQGTTTWITPDGQELSSSASTATSRITAPGHGFNRGDIVRFTGVPPAPLTAGEVYYAAPVDTASFRVGATLEAVEDVDDATEIVLTDTGGTFATLNGRVLGNGGHYTIPAGSLPAGKAIEWTVATQGRYSGVEPFSPWAPISGFRTASKPTATISYPDAGSTIGDPAVMVAWGFYTPDPDVVQQWAHVSLWESGASAPLEEYESDGEWFDYTFITPLTNGQEYVIGVTVEGSNGIRSEQTLVTFAAEYVGPTAPGVSLSWDAEDGLVVIDIANPGGEDEPPASSNEVWRSVGGGGFTKLASGIPVNTSWIDYLPQPDAINTYRVVAVAANGTRRAYDVAAECSNSGDWYWLNGGPGWGTIAKVRYEAGVTVRFSRSKTLQEFAGRDRPVEFTGTVRTHTLDLSALLPRDAEGYEASDALKRLVDVGGPVFYRDPVGRRLKCSIGEVEMADSGNLIDFRTTLTEVAS